MARLKRTLGTATLSVAMFVAVGASGHSCATEPGDGATPVVKTTKKPKKGTPAVEFHCFKNNGKKVCTRRPEPK